MVDEQKPEIDSAIPGADTALLIPETAAAAMVGVSPATWRRLHSANKTPGAVRLGRAVRWRRAEIVAWIEAGCPDRGTWDAIADRDRRRLPANGSRL
jgi:predicted DNA-binding transcriptional regulator AlpA